MYRLIITYSFLLSLVINLSLWTKIKAIEEYVRAHKPYHVILRFINSANLRPIEKSEYYYDIVDGKNIFEKETPKSKTK